MMFLFAYLGTLNGGAGWPFGLMYGTEAAFVVVTFVCILLAVSLRRQGTQAKRELVATIGGICASFGLIMPFELAPFFFGARGEIMLATIALNLVYPLGIALFIFLFRKFMNKKSPGTPVIPPGH
jgi:thiosulfate dehydrogenase (quinone) large subunit